MSPDPDGRTGNFERRYEDVQRRWQMVLDKKHQNTETKNKNMKEMLAKKFKREKEVAKKNAEEMEVKNYDIDKRNELAEMNQDRKKTSRSEIRRG